MPRGAPLRSPRGWQGRSSCGREPLVGRSGQGREGEPPAASARDLRRAVLPHRRGFRAGARPRAADRLEPEVARGGEPAPRRLGRGARPRRGCAREPPTNQVGHPMAASEDELAKQKVKEAFWQWTGRLIVLAVTFGFGFFAAFILWGAGINGAPALRILKEQQEAQILERKNKEVDLSGKLTVIQSRLEQCIADLQKARAAGSAPPP